MDMFTLWLQRRLNKHKLKDAAPIEEDGIIGPETRCALLDFQRRKRLPLTEVADDQTIRMLRIEPKGAAVVEPLNETMPPWLAEMSRRMGMHERRDNIALADWLRAGRFLGNPAKLPWCGDAVETCFARTLAHEPLPSNPFWAQAWADFGMACDGPHIGSVGVIKWSSRAGHVGFVINHNKDKVMLRGGNQSDMIRDVAFDRSFFIAFRWPKSYPMRDYPRIASRGMSGGFSGTR